MMVVVLEVAAVYRAVVDQGLDTVADTVADIVAWDMDKPVAGNSVQESPILG